MATLLKIGSTDFTSYLAQGGFGQSVNVLVNEARDVQGNANFDIINQKIKLTCKFRPLNRTEMAAFKAAIAPYIVSVTYIDATTNADKTITAYVGENTQEYYFVNGSNFTFNTFTCNFIEM